MSLLRCEETQCNSSLPHSKMPAITSLMTSCKSAVSAGYSSLKSNSLVPRAIGEPALITLTRFLDSVAPAIPSKKRNINHRTTEIIALLKVEAKQAVEIGRLRKSGVTSGHCLQRASEIAVAIMFAMTPRRWVASPFPSGWTLLLRMTTKASACGSTQSDVPVNPVWP